jgi:hypothetical protein
VFGCLKAEAKKAFRMIYSQNPSAVFKTKDAVKILTRLWQQDNQSLLEEAWDIYL